SWHVDGAKRGRAVGAPEGRYRAVSTRLRNDRIAPFGPAPQGFDQMAPSVAGAKGSIPLGIDPFAPPPDHHHLVESKCQLSAGQDTSPALMRARQRRCCSSGLTR